MNKEEIKTITKSYIDIECYYDDMPENITKSMYRMSTKWNIWLIGVLNIKVETNINNNRSSIVERSFNQFNFLEDGISNYNIHNIKEIIEWILKSDLIVSWNGRTFDYPILKNHLNINDEKLIDNILSKDRDLIDICSMRNIPIKGGLGKVAKNLDIDFDYTDKDTGICNSKRNEFDVKILKEIELKLNLICDGRINIDNYRINW